MARSAADLGLELAVVAGPDELTDGIGYKLALPSPRHDKLADFRVLVIDKHPLCPTAPAITAALNGLTERLGKAGCRILRDSTKLLDLAQTGRTYRQSLAAAAVHGLTMSHADWIRRSCIRGGLRARWLALFQDVDVVLCPPMPTVAFPHDHSPQLARQLDIDGTKVPYNDQSVWAGIATLNGLPATTAPIGHSDDGLPISTQIVGGYLEDRTTIAFAGLIEREFDGFTPPPNL